MRKTTLLLGTLALVLLLSGAQPRVSAAQEARPNIVFLLADDQRKDDMLFIPRTKALVGGEGAIFENAFVNYAMCCPSRATLLTGNYPHNHGVLDNTPLEEPPGGAPAFVPNEDKALPTWLDRAGYETALMGKYFNGYSGEHVPPGWDRWLAGTPQGFATEDGTMVNAFPQHKVDFLAQHAEEFIRSSQTTPDPFLLYLAPSAPHPPAIPPERYAEDFSALQLDRFDPAFNEADVSDKPAFISGKRRLTQKQLDAMDNLYRNRARSMQGIDDMTERVVNVLKETGQLENTYIVYFSDNGFHMGEHRLRPRKSTAYEEDIRVPLMIRGPGIAPGQRSAALVLNNDLAPTFAEWAGVNENLPYTPDGRSLAPLLDQDPSNDAWRERFLVEKWGRTVTPGYYRAVRTDSNIMILHADDTDEFYDLSIDPMELDNRYSEMDPTLRDSLDQHLSALVACSGESCKSAEN